MTRGTGRRATVGLAAVGALAVVGSSCTTTAPASSCQTGAVAAYPASPLMLLPETQLHRLPDGFMLFGVDHDVLRWAHIDGQRNAGKEQSTPLPAARRAGPWFAAAGRTAPGDSVLVAYGLAASNGTDLDVNVIAVPADGSGAPSAPTVVVTIAGGAQSGAAPLVTVATSTTGLHAGLAWSTAAGATVMVTAIGGDGQRLGAPVMVDDAKHTSCIGFVAGKNQLSLAYLRTRTDDQMFPEWVVAEMKDSPNIEATLTLLLTTDQPSCPLAVATPGGYALAWQNAGGSRLGSYTAGDNQFVDHLFVSAVEFGGPNLQPPLVGLGLAGSDLAVVFARAGAAEVWRVTADGVRQPGTLLLPSQSGNLGGVSTVPVGASLFASYADYQPATTGTTRSGQRYLIEIKCL